LAHGDLSGSWPVHLREPPGNKLNGVGSGRLVSIRERPDFWLDSRADPSGRPRGDLGARGELRPDNAHVPSLTYVPYLLTGDRYYADEMAFWADYALLATFQDGYSNLRGGAKGLLHGNEPRGVAWALRNLVDAAAYLPDADAAQAYLREKVENNLAWADQYAATHETPLGTYFEGQDPDQIQRKLWALPRPWQNNYIAWSLDHALQQGFTGGRKLRDRLADFQLRLFTTPGFDRSYAGPYTLVVGKKKDGGGIEYLKTLAEVYRATYGDPPAKATSFAGYYGVDARLSLIIARQNGWAGAQDAYGFLFPQLTRPSNDLPIPDLVKRSGWAIALEGEP
jgi:hypothetical protein